MSTSARPVSAGLRRTALAGLVLALGACGHAGDDANLRVVLAVDGALVADCAVVEVQGAGGATAQTLVDLAAGKGEYAVAVKRGALPAEVTLAVSAYTGHCDEPAARALATRAPPQTASFPAAGVAEVRVVLGLPDASLDADRDGYVARAAGGSDCGDDDVRVHPGAPQDCASERDTDCDTLVYCDDPDCAADPACVRPATAMAFAPAAVSRVAAACWPLTLEFRAVDGPASLARPTVLEFSQDSSGVQFFTDAACATLATRRPVAFGQKVLALYGRKATLGAATGTVTDLATTRPLAPATLAYTGVNHRLRFDGAPAALASGQCSGRVWVRLEGASGSFQVTGPTDVTLTASGPVADGVTFYAASDTCAAGGTTSLVRTLQSPESGFWLAFKASRPGRVVLTATDPGQPDQIAVDVGAGLPDHLWMAGLSGVEAGACSGPIDVELRDATDAVTGAPAALSFTFATTVLDPPGWAGEPVQLFADGACAAPAGPLPFAPGQSRARVSFRSTRAPLTFGVVATALLAGAADAGPTAVQGRAQWNVKSGAPVALALATVDGGVPALVRDGCTSAPLWLELQDALGNPAGATHQEDVVWGPLDAGLAFFPASATGCSGAPLGTVTLAQDQTMAGVLLSTLGRVAGPITVEARSAAWGRVTVSLPIPDATGHLAVQAPVAVEAGGCEPVQVSRRKAQGGPASWGEVTVQLTSSDPALTVHGDAACSSSGPVALVLAHGQSEAPLAYVAGHSSPSRVVRLEATTSPVDFLPGAADVVALPLVRRGTCTLALADASATCAPAPPIPAGDISRTFLLYQASPHAWTPTDAAVECHLTPGAQVACARAGSTSLSPVEVSWQTVSFGRPAALGGVSVRHLVGHAPALATWTHAFPPVDPARSFLLFGSAKVGAVLSGNDFPTVRLTDAGEVTLTAAPAQTLDLGYSTQVVEFAGAAVVRGAVEGSIAAEVTVTPVPDAALGRTVVFSTVRVDAATDDEVLCKRRVRSEVLDGGSLFFSRGGGAGQAACASVASTITELAWERVEFPPAVQVQSSLAELPNGLPQLRWALPSPVVTDRAVVFSGSMGPSGQAWGESDWVPSAGALAAGTADDLGAFCGVMSFADGGSAVSVTRGYAGDGGVGTPGAEVVSTRLTAFVVQFQP